jgi:hypothetical protein
MGSKFVALIAIATATTTISPNAGVARSGPYQAKPGESPLETKCHSEASMIGVGGKGIAVAAESNRQMRREHFKKCMAGG